MNIIVCIKQVPNAADVKIDPKTNTLVREGVKSIINPFDSYAIEEGVRIKERCGGKVTVISMGPPQAQEALKEAISVGADEAILLSDRAFAGADTLATSYTLCCAVRKIALYDIIVCGRQTIDGDTGQVGPEMAVRLDVPFIPYVSKIEEIREGYIRVQRMMDDGYEQMESSLPAVMTVVKEINTPRVPSLRGMARAKNAAITTWSAADLSAPTEKIGLNGSPTQVVKVFVPKRERQAKMLTGSIEEQVRQLVGKLRGGGVLQV